MIKFSTFKTVRDTAPSDEITSLQLIKWIISNDQRQLVEEIRSAPDKDTRSRYKAALPAVTASGVFSKRAASALITHSGILIADLDTDENPQLIDAKQMATIREKLQSSDKTHFAFVSPSGGLKVGVKIDATDADTHKAAFATVRDWFADSHGLVIDKACSDVSRLCFLSHDPAAYYNAKSKVIKTEAAKSQALPFWAVKPSKVASDGTSPGDQFNKKADVAGLLQSQGWTTRNGKHWTRPGKSGGISGTFGVVGDRKFYCWTSSAAPLEANESYSPFALFAMFHHGGDFKAAATALAAEGYGEQSIEQLPADVVATIDQLVSNALQKEADSWLPPITEAEEAKKEIEQSAKSTGSDFLSNLRKLVASTDENIEAMKKRAQDAVFILPEIAMLGDCTILNAGPNTGKTLMTLWMLCNRDMEKTKHLDIFYINADDSFNGGIEKMEITRHMGIHHLIPNQNGFDPADLSKIIKAAIKEDACGNMVIVLDTLKKFVSTMDKNDARVFNIMVRSFTQAGGTLIALAHTNKNKDADGKSIAEGVGDFQSDFDCAYTIDKAPVITEGSDRTIVFENTKLRGPNSMKVTFQYDAGEKRSWHRRFQSVKQVGAEEARAAEEKAAKEAQLDKDQSVIEYILSELEDGPKTHSGLIRDNLGDPSTGSCNVRTKVIERYTGKYWGKSKSQNGGWTFHKQSKNQVGNLVRFGL